MLRRLILWQEVLLNANRILIAYSGGIDSSVLLHLFCSLRKKYPQFAALKLHAVHVHHGLLSSADKWALHCAKVCEEFAVLFQLIKVNLSCRKESESIEAAARKVRYQAFLDMTRAGDIWVTAHQQNDQAETFLLRILRGSGISGLTAIAEKRPFGEGMLIRPFLSVARAEIRKYAEKNKLVWIEDESNHDLHFARNFLRHKVAPLLDEKWPSWDRVVSRLVQNSVESNLLLEELAENDLKNIENEDHSVAIAKLKKLSFLRQKNALRYLVKCRGFLAPQENQLNQVFKLIDARDDAMPLVVWKGIQVRRYKNTLYIIPPLEFFDADNVYNWEMEKPLFISGVGTIGTKQVESGGIDKTKIKLPLSIRFRKGGEKICLSGRQGTHAIKKLFQEWNIPPWERARIPLIYDADGKLIAVVNYAVAKDVIAEKEGISVILQKSPQR